MAEFITKHWNVITSAPLTFVLFAVIIIPSVIAITKSVLGGALDAARERLAAYKDEVERLKSHEDELVKQLQAHGLKIEEIEASLAAAPKIHVSPEPPKEGFGKDGDIWLQYKE